MVDPEILAAHGLDAEGLKKYFNKPRAERSDEVNALIQRMVNRCRGGRDMNLERYKVFRAVDVAWDSAFEQITPTLLSAISDKSPDDPSVAEILKDAGLDINQVVVETPDPKTPNKSSKRVVVPAFYNITVPLCAAYLKIRQAKLVNDRRQVPMFKYDPVISDEIARVKCTLITQRVETMAKQYGYFDTLKQAVFQMLHYAEALQFPVEEWHSEYQWVADSSPYPKCNLEDSEKEIDGEKIKKIVTKEGLRYHLPHPMRTYYDRAYPASTFNTDTGCTYAGYWRVLRWVDVMRQKDYYNLEEVGYDNFWGWFNGVRNHSYWINALQGCTLNFPNDGLVNSGVSKLDNEANVARWYSRDWTDKPIVLAEHFEKLIPSECGLGDYDCPIWIRFVLAADDNVVYAAPVCFDPPILFWGYDYVHGRTHNASMTLEVLPFQDQFSNLLAQHLLSVRQNLMNISLIDTDVIPEAEIKKLENVGERLWRNINIFRASFDKLFKRKASGLGGGDPIRGAVVSHKFPVQNTTELLNAMKVILDTLERVLVMSSQEVGQSASHEQTREEVRLITQNTSTRVTFTGIGVDTAIDSWKKQLYNGLMSYGEMGFYAQVPMENPMDREALEKLGFTAEGKYDEKSRKQYIRGDRTAVAYESFVSDRDGQDRVNDMESGKIMLQVFSEAIANPMLAPAIGPDQAIKWINFIGRFLGFPRDFKLENTGQTKSSQDQTNQALMQLKQQIDQAVQALSQDVKGALGPIIQTNHAQDVELKQISDQLNQIMGQPGEQQPPSPVALDSNFAAPAQAAA